VRLENLAQYCGQVLLEGRISTDRAEYWIKVDPIAKRVIHLEKYDSGSQQPLSPARGKRLLATPQAERQSRNVSLQI
jgi:hypothetical protein